MSHIAPFRGIRYTPEAGPLDHLVAPPYDVITTEERAELVSRNRGNIVAVDLPVGDGDEKYAAAGALWREWMGSGVLRPDKAPAIYLIREEFIDPHGREGARTGFVCEMELESFGVGKVRPHERTYAGPKVDRLKLMRATAANTSQVFALYRDPERTLDAAWERVMAEPPTESVTAPDGRRDLWVVTEEDVIRLAKRTLALSALTIADGHHRYETALTFRDECRERGINPGADRLMVYLSSIDDPSLTILAAHRAVRLVHNPDMAAIRETLEEYFELEPVASDHPEAWLASRLRSGTGEPYQFGFFAREWGWLLATLRSWDNVAGCIGPERSEAWRRLDLAVLHDAVLDNMVGLTQDMIEAERAVSYFVEPALGRDKVVAGDAALFCMVRPTAAWQIAEVADAGDTMPQKSTYFYPKLLTGLVMRSLD